VAHEHSGFKDKMTHTSLHSAAQTPEQTTNAALDLSAMIASRICHDLVSPMGAIGNGLELLELSQSTSGPELELISQSIASATARLRFYRIAFGTVSAEQMISHGEILSVLSELGKYQKQNFHWENSTDLSRRQVKLTLLLVMCLESALPWGGDIHVRDFPGGVELLASSDRVKIDDGLWAYVAERTPCANMSSAKIQFAAAVAELIAQNAAITVLEEQSGLRLTVVFA